MFYHIQFSSYSKKWTLVISDSSMMNHISKEYEEYKFDTIEELLKYLDVSLRTEGRTV